MTRDHDPSSSPPRPAAPAAGRDRAEDGRDAPPERDPDAVRVDPVRSPERRRIQALARTYREHFRHRHVDDG